MLNGTVGVQIDSSEQKWPPFRNPTYNKPCLTHPRTLQSALLNGFCFSYFRHLFQFGTCDRLNWLSVGVSPHVKNAVDLIWFEYITIIIHYNVDDFSD